jgi:tRNA dimethylallyltransferase
MENPTMASPAPADDRPWCLALAGPTAAGKTAAALALARELPLEIVSVDSALVYRGMDIGTAKLSVAERRGVPHHLIDVLDVTAEASVAQYQLDARAAIETIQARGSVPVLVGGSGLYLAAVLTDFRFPGTDPERRAHWEAELERLGPDGLHDVLASRDPAAAAAIGPHNGRRLVRALEVGDLTGEPFLAGLEARGTAWRRYRQFALGLERPALVARLDDRVRRMWRNGLLDEVRTLLPRGLDRGVTASRAIGYAQAMAQLRGELDELQAIEQTQSLTRRYARRQVSWLRRDPAVEWLDAAADDLDAQVDRSVAGELVDSMGP